MSKINNHTYYDIYQGKVSENIKAGIAAIIMNNSYSDFFTLEDGMHPTSIVNGSSANGYQLYYSYVSHEDLPDQPGVHKHVEHRCLTDWLSLFHITHDSNRDLIIGNDITKINNKNPTAESTKIVLMEDTQLGVNASLKWESNANFLIDKDANAKLNTITTNKFSVNSSDDQVILGHSIFFKTKSGLAGPYENPSAAGAQYTSGILATTQYVKDYVGSLGKVLTYQGTLANYSDLPAASEANKGYVYNITNAVTLNGKTYPPGTNWASSGTEWDPLGGDISQYVAKTEFNSKVEEINNKFTNYVAKTGDETVSGVKTFKSGIKIGNPSVTSNVNLNYNSTEECLEFIFS